MMNGKKPSGAGWQACKALLQMGVMASKSLYLPAATPAAVVQAWRDAIRKVLDDPEFQSHAATVIEGYPQFVGEAARPIIKEATTFTPETWDWIRNYLKTQHNITLE